jgi:hypothetical protein
MGLVETRPPGRYDLAELKSAKCGQKIGESQPRLFTFELHESPSAAMPSVHPNRLTEELKSYGIAPERLHFFGETHQSPEIHEYLTLDALRRRSLPSPDGVAEHQGRPILYFVDEQRLGRTSPRPKQSLFEDSPRELVTIFQQLACRGERAYLARVQHGKLLVAPVSPTEREPEWNEYTPNSASGRSLFSRLVDGVTSGDDFAVGDVVFNRLFTLIKHAANTIAKNVSIRPDALSLVGRALFFRFLRDRGVLDDYPVNRIAPAAASWSDCFRNAKNASATCAWLDETFNGDFLPLSDNGSESFFDRIGEETNGEVFRNLNAVVRGHDPVGKDYQPMLSWEWQEFDFAHIPVGLLSQVYEAFSLEWSPKEARANSQHYTPRNIALTLMDEVMDGLPEITSCRVLDPACGAGVFLVLAFRRLYLERWKEVKKASRPGTHVIREILETQLVGMDISESALKLAALSLYLTAIELDPEPTPPSKLKFKKLRGRVLYDVREPGGRPENPTLGSLGLHLGRKFKHAFNVVLGNPPWTSVDKSLGGLLGDVCRNVLDRINGELKSNFELPDNNPDIPFLIKSLEWCKPGGRIAMALPARILLKSAEKPKAARELLFRTFQVDGIVNGTNLADTAVWPKMNQPWMLLFASNKRPRPHHSVPLVTIPLDVTANKAGSYRIDSRSNDLIDLESACEKPWIWKALSVGTALDVEVIDKMAAAGGEPLDDYWERVVGKHRSGKGYQLAEKQDQLSYCEFLKGLPQLDSTELFKFVVDASVLEKFSRTQVWRPRKSSIYDPPLVLVKQSPGEKRQNGRALLAFKRIAYKEIFNGYSGSGHTNGESLARYLHLFVHSDLWLFFLLVTSPEFGAERRRARKSDLGNCPFIPWEKLTNRQRKEVETLSKSLVAGRNVPWHDIDAFFAALYGLGKHDLQVILDTLAVALPYKSARQNACREPSLHEKTAFIKSLRRALGPIVASQLDATLEVERLRSSDSNVNACGRYDVIVLRTSDRPMNSVAAIVDGVIGNALSLADETGASLTIVRDHGALIVGLFNQYRYWTASRARLLAGDIVRSHLDAFNR